MAIAVSAKRASIIDPRMEDSFHTRNGLMPVTLLKEMIRCSTVDLARYFRKASDAVKRSEDSSLKTPERWSMRAETMLSRTSSPSYGILVCTDTLTSIYAKTLRLTVTKSVILSFSSS